MSGLMRYPVVIHKERDSDYGVSVPDLPGCVTAGTTVDEALAMASEAIALHLEQIIEDGEVVPEPSAIEALRGDPDYADGTWAMVAVNPADLRNKARRINITLPERTLEVIDQFAADHHETRSGLLLRAVTSYMRERRPQAKTTNGKSGRRHRRR